MLARQELGMGPSQGARRQCLERFPILEPVEQAAALGQRPLAEFGLAKPRELAQRGLAAQRIDQQEDLPCIFTVLHQLANRAIGGDRMLAGYRGCGNLAPSPLWW